MGKDIIKKIKELYSQGKFKEIISLLTDEFLEQQKDAALYFIRGNAWYDKKEYDKAIADYDEAIKLNPKYAKAYYSRGIAWKNKKEYEKAIADYDKAIELKSNNAEAYNNRGNVWSDKKEYDKAIADYDKAIEFNPNNAEAYNNRGNVWSNKKEYDKAIADYDKAIELKSNNAEAYNNRGNVWSNKEEYDKAIADYDKAIELKSNFVEVYYNRGNIWYNKKEYNKAIADYEKVKEIQKDKNDLLYRVAEGHIKELKELIDINNNSGIKDINDLISDIKNLLLIKEEYVTHYTSLSALRSLIFSENNKFRIYEGNFMNDPSEGREFFNFLYGNNKNLKKKRTPRNGKFEPKPFIGSFVISNKYDNDGNLNMWRFYGKENGEDARGCSILLSAEEFISNINSSFDEENKDLVSYNDINFYKVAYFTNKIQKNKKKEIDFYISTKKNKKLGNFMSNLRDKVKSYKGNRNVLNKYLNSIAFLFKNESYKTEKEVRLVVKGTEFDKNFDETTLPPRVFIELVPIKDSVKKITLGPKVDKIDEWQVAINYLYEKEPDIKKLPEVKKSTLPYK